MNNNEIDLYKAYSYGTIDNISDFSAKLSA